jgi:hypothetical protein
MKPFLTRTALIALLLGMASAIPAQPAPAPDAVAKGETLIALERKLLGIWQGPACGGDYDFKSEGTFTCRNYTPGQNTLTGTWSLRWDALPPTLVLLTKTSDFKQKYPKDREYDYLNKPLELKVLKLDAEKLVLKFPDATGQWSGRRPEKE